MSVDHPPFHPIVASSHDPKQALRYRPFFYGSPHRVANSATGIGLSPFGPIPGARPSTLRGLTAGIVGRTRALVALHPSSRPACC